MNSCYQHQGVNLSVVATMQSNHHRVRVYSGVRGVVYVTKNMLLTKKFNPFCAVLPHMMFSVLLFDIC